MPIDAVNPQGDIVLLTIIKNGPVIKVEPKYTFFLNS